MYRYVLAGAVLALAAMSPASADDDGWKGPGWYLMYMAVNIVTGPYASQADCESDLAGRPKDSGLSCEYMDKDL